MNSVVDSLEPASAPALTDKWVTTQGSTELAQSIVGSLATLISSFVDVLGVTSTAYGDVPAQFGALTNSLNALDIREASDFGAAAAAINAVSSNLAVESGALSARIDIVSGGVFNAVGSIAFVNGRVDTVSSNLAVESGALSARIDTLSSNLAVESGALSARIDIVSGGVFNAVGSISFVNGRVDTVSSNLAVESGALSARIDTVSGGVFNAVGSISFVNGRVDTVSSNLAVESGALSARIDTTASSVNALPRSVLFPMANGTVVESHSSHASTLAIKTLLGADPSGGDPVKFFFRDPTATLGDYVVRTLTTALSITIPQNATLGHVSARDQQIILYAQDNAGTVELVVGCPLVDQSVRLQSSTTINGSATSASTLYAATGRSNIAMLPLARIVTNQTTAGTWDASPSKIDLAPFTLPTNECIIYLANNQVIAAATLTKVTYDAVFFDPDSIADVTTNHRIQPKVPGSYAISVVLYEVSLLEASNYALGYLMRSGSTHALFAGQPSIAANDYGAVLTTLAPFNGTTDYLEAFAYMANNFGNNITLAAGVPFNSIVMWRVGP